MQKLFYFMVAWIPSRWVDEHEAVLYKQREPLSIQAASICLYNYNPALSKRDRAEERERLRECIIKRESCLGFRI